MHLDVAWHPSGQLNGRNPSLTGSEIGDTAYTRVYRRSRGLPPLAERLRTGSRVAHPLGYRLPALGGFPVASSNTPGV